ncbi:MAG: 2OG-Fe(II) oxygenase [Poseidonibacter sp.]
MTQISNKVYCADFLTLLNIETKFLPNPYYDYPYLIIENFISNKGCKEINSLIKKDRDYQKAQVKIKENITFSKTNESIRKTNIYKLNRKYLTIYKNSFKKNQALIEDYFKMAITKSTKVQTLEYLKDFFYKMHSDDSSMIYKDDNLVGFLTVSNERKLSSVLFTTSYDEEITDDTFTGGELLFNYLYDENNEQIKIKAKTGMMIIFPSNPFFTHEVLKVKEGRRISLVQWHNTL